MRPIFLLLLSDGWQIIGVVAALVAAGATAFYTYYTWELVKGSKESQERANKIAEFDIYMRLSERLNSGGAETIFHHSIDHALTDSTFLELRRQVFNPLEDLAKFWQDGLISIDTIDNGFGYLILELGTAPTVNSAMLSYRTHYANDVYSGFEKMYAEIYNRCHANSKRKYREPSKLFQIDIV